ncbi:MAG: hypothetical protein DLM72_08295 [Candidatus Nitrosopolaris wilkensis]|nr:MAG: hypothetical protein DLM72_08295 [Candidatus Nitrosopolaris wilkensis]
MIKDTQRDLIIKRRDAVSENPDLITIDRWDLSKVFYDTRTILDKLGYDTSPMNVTAKRKAIHNDIADICDDLGVKRHEIGIFAADRAQMAFDGQIYNVTFETFGWLARLGTDIIFTEKEGLVNTLVPFTTDMGIALVQSGGWSSEYAEFLIKEAQRLGFNNIGILTDFDSQGVGIALEYLNVARLGVDLQTISDLGVNLQDVEEHIEPLKFNKKTKKMEENSHWVGLKAKLEQMNNSWEIDLDEYKQFREFYDPFIRANLTYLRSNRVELGAITANVGPERFWNWLANKILDAFPQRDYNRAMKVPELLYPKPITDYLAKLNTKLKSVLKQSNKDWKETLTDFDGFIDSTNDKLDEIEKDMHDNIMMTDKDVKALIKDIDDLGRKEYLG